MFFPGPRFTEKSNRASFDIFQIIYRYPSSNRGLWVGMIENVKLTTSHICTYELFCPPEKRPKTESFPGPLPSLLLLLHFFQCCFSPNQQTWQNFIRMNSRFPELSHCLREAGADILTFPSAFTVPTGLAHWKPLLQVVATYCGLIRFLNRKLYLSLEIKP